MMSPQVLRLSLEVLIHALQAEVEATVTTALQRYKSDYDRRVLLTTLLQPGSWVSINRPPFEVTYNTDST